MLSASLTDQEVKTLGAGDLSPQRSSVRKGTAEWRRSASSVSSPPREDEAALRDRPRMPHWGLQLSERGTVATAGEVACAAAEDVGSPRNLPDAQAVEAVEA